MTEKPSLKQYNPYSFFYVSAIENDYMPSDSSCNVYTGEGLTNFIQVIANGRANQETWWTKYRESKGRTSLIETSEDFLDWINAANQTDDPNGAKTGDENNTKWLGSHAREDYTQKWGDDTADHSYKAHYDMQMDNGQVNYGDCLTLGDTDAIIANEDIIKRCLDASLCRNKQKSMDYVEKMNRDGSAEQRYSDVKTSFDEEFMNTVNLIAGSLFLGGLIFKHYYSK